MDVFENVKEKAIECFGEKSADIFETAEKLMDTEGVIMHCPAHHFIVPAALALCIYEKEDRDRFIKDLETMKQRAEKVPGGFCGNCGCCGAAVGVGIFVSVFTGASPKKRAHWDDANAATAEALSAIANIGGPRCCKRVTFIALMSAAKTVDDRLGIKLEIPAEHACKYHAMNEECIGRLCPFRKD